MHTSHLPIAVVFLLAAFFIPSANLFAQPMLTAAQSSTSCGDSQTTICVTMDDMSNANGVSHQLQWDPSILAFNSVSVNTTTYPTLSAANAFSLTSSTFNFTWFAIGSANFVDGDILYCLVFDVISPIGASGTLVEQSPESNRGGSPPANQIITNGSTILGESLYTFNGITVMATSGSGMDTTSPVVSGCPSDINLTTTGTSAMATWTAPTATDNCGTVSSTSTHNSGDSFPIGTTAVQYDFQDDTGNTVPCTFNVTVTGGGGGGTGTGPGFVFSQGALNCDASQVEFCILAQDLMNVAYIAHVISWDNAVLQFNSTTNLTTEGPSGFASNTANTLNFVFNSNLTGATGSDFTNGDIIYCIVFDIIGDISTGTPVIQYDTADGRPSTFPGPVNEIIFADGTSTSTHTFNDGAITSSGGTSTIDTTPPVVSGCPSDINLTTTGTTAVATWTPPTATDACSTVNSTSTHNNGDSFPIGTTMVQYNFTDASGNPATCTFNVTVTMSTAGTGPGFVFSQGALNCDASQVEFCILAEDLMNIAYIGHVINWDNTVLQFNSTTNVTTEGPTGFASNTTNTLNFVFNSNLVGAVGTDFTNGDIIYCIVFDVIGDISGGTTVIQFDTADGRPSTFPGPDNEIIFADGTNSSTYTFADGTITTSGGTSTIDTTPPVVSGCPSDITLSTTATSAIAMWTPPTAVDACGNVISASTHNSGDTFPLGTTPVTYTFTDDAGNISPCTFNVIVTAPSGPGLVIESNTIDCGNQTLEVCITTSELSDIVYIGHVITWDASILSYTGTTNETTDGTIGFANNTTNTLNAVYNSTLSSGQDFMDGDILYCITFDVIGDATAGVLIEQFEETDRPTGFPGPPNEIFVSGSSIPIPYTFTSTTISASDVEAPIFTSFPMNLDTFLTANCDASVSWVAPTITDDCAVTSTSSTHNPGDVFPLGDTEVIYTAMDAAGNVTMDTFNITVVDTIPPMVQNCPMDTVIEVTTGTTSSTHTWQAPTGMDNCPGVTIVSTANPGDSFPIGTTTVTYTITDASGNEVICSFVVTVMEELDIICPADVMAFTTPNGCDTIVNNINIVINDPSNVQSITWAATGATITSGTGDASGTSFNAGTTTLTYTVTANDNTSQMCSFDIVVVDNQMPTLFCPPTATVQIPSTQTTVVFDDINGLISDNCSSNDDLIITHSLSGATTATGAGFATGLPFNVGTTTVTYTVSDGTNTTDCSFDVIVEQVALEIECPTDVTVSTSSADCDAMVANIDVVVTAGTALTISYTSMGATILGANGDASGSTFNVGTTTVTYLVTDASANSTTCSFDVTVEDNTPPMLMCRADTTLTVPFGTSSMVVNGLEILTANDNCTTLSGMTLSYVLTGATTGMNTGDANGLMFNVGSTVVTYTLTDENDNSTTCVFNVIVNNPSIAVDCPNDTSVITSIAGTCNEMIGNLSPIISPTVDSAMTVLYSTTGATTITGIDDISDETFNTGITNVMYTVVSNMNDTVRCDFNVTVLDTFPPSFSCPADLTILSSNMDTTAVVTGIALQGLTSCDPTTSVTYTLSGATNSTGNDDASGQTFQADTTEVTYFVMDSSGNRDSCEFLVIVEPAPIRLMCPEDVSIAVTTDSCTAVVSTIALTVTDTGAVETITYLGTGATSFISDTTGINDASNEVFNVGSTDVTYTVTDTLGNIATCTLNVMVQDTSDLFVICPNDVTVFITMEDSTAVVNGIGLVDYGFACSPNDDIVVNYAIGSVIDTLDASGNTFELGGTGVTYFVADSFGNVERCTFTVNVEQRSPLDIDCPNDVTVSNEIDLCSGIANNIEISVADISLIDTVTYVLSGALIDTLVSDTLVDLSGMTFPVGTTTVSYNISDTLGYFAECSFDVIVEDTQDPILECPVDVTILAPEGDTSVVINNLGLQSVSDNCGNLNISVTYSLSGATTSSGNNDASGETFNIGMTTVTYTLTDGNDNSISCSFDVEVIESGELGIACPPDMEVSAATTSCAAVVNNLSITILSPDSIIQSIVYGLRGATVADSAPTGINDASGELFQIGLTTVTYIVTDTLGRIASCSFTVNVSDESGPRLDCPADVVINIPFTDSTAVANNLALILAADNCDPDPVITYELTGATVGTGTEDASGNVFNIGNTVVTYTVTDDLGQSSTCAFEVLVGQFGIMLDCPDNITIQSDTMNCGTSLDSISFQVSPLASVSTISYELSGATSFQSRTDTISDASGEFFNVGTTTVTYTVNDTLECSFNVTVQDRVAPIFVNCPDTMRLGMDVERCFATVRWRVPDIIEGCDFVMVPNVEPGTEVEIIMMSGDTTITYTATDVNGNTSSCSFNITVRDDQLPNHIFCPEQEEDIRIMQSDTICGAIVEWDEPQNFDNCGVVSSMQTHQPGDIFPYGLTTVVYTAFDLEGNSGTCSFDVLVVDSLQTNLVGCPMDIAITVTEPDSTAIVSWIPPTAGGVCGDLTITSNFMPGDTFPMGTTEVVYTANDTISMFSETCTFNITVQIEDLVEIDTIPPAFLDCPSDINTAFNDGECFATATWEEPTAIDNGRIDSLFVSHMPGDTFLVGTTEILYIAIDSIGNRDTCAFNVMVEGPQNSVLICPSNVTVIAPLAACGSVVDWTPPTLDRPCSDAPISIVGNFAPGTLFPVGTTEVIYIASDTISYADTCSFMITVLDQELPVFTGCPDDVILSVELGSCEASFDWAVPTVSDNCGIAQTVPTHEPPFAFPIGETVVTYTTTDISGNTNNCQFIVTVLDDSAPTFAACPDTVRVSADGTIMSDPSGVITAISSADCSSVQLSFDTPTASEACGTLEVTQTDGTGLASGSSFAPGTTTLTFSASDDSNNTATCELIIIVEDVATGTVNITVDNPVVCAGGNVQLVGEDVGIPGATYQWIIPNNSVPFDGATLDIFSITVMQSGTYVLNVTTPTGCSFSNSTTIEVQAEPSVSVSHNDTDVVCGGGNADLVFTAATLSDITTWQWTGPNNFSSTEQSPTITNASATDSGNYTVTAMTAAGCSSTGMTTVTIREEPAIPTLLVSGGNGISPVDGVTIIGCSADTFNLIGRDYGTDNVQYIWNVTPNDFGFDPGNTSIAQAVPIAGGDYTFEYAVLVDGCPSDSVRVSVNVEAQPSIQTMIDGATSCVNEGSSIELQAVADGVMSWEWFNPDGSPLANTQNVTLDTLTENLSGAYRVLGTTANGCTAEATLQVILSGQLEMPTIGQLGNVCDGDDLLVSLGGNYPEGVEFQWHSDSTALNFVTTDTDFNAADLAAGTYSAMITASGNGCVSDSTTVSFTILERPSIDFSGVQTTYDCVATDTSFQLMEMGIDGSKWFWSSTSGYTSPEQNPTYTVTFDNTPMSDTLYLQLTGENGCTAMDSIILNFNQGVAQPTIVGAARYCMGETLALRLRDDLPDSTSYSWIGPNGFVSMDSMIVVPNTGTAQAGQYQVVATVGACVSAPSDSFTVTVVTPPTVEPDNYVVFVGQTDTLDITNNDNLIDNLTISLGLTNPSFLGTTSLQGGTVGYTAPNTVGSDNFSYEICYDVCDDPNLILCDEAIVNVDVRYPPEQCVITTLVTPNNDGNNENLIVTCTEGDVYPDHELIIFNQWGDEVFRAAPYNNDWSGEYNGGQLPDGTYFYIFVPVPGEAAQKGFITLYR